MSIDVSGDAAFFYEAEAYSIAGKKLMGRNAAGKGFLRAATLYRRRPAMWGYAASRGAATNFSAQVKVIDPLARTLWCPRHRLDLLSKLGTLYRPDPILTPAANLRLRAGVDAYSLCGITHTTASHSVMDQLATLFHGPLMPWDAIICTSRAVAATIEDIQTAETHYLKWRFGEDALIPDGPQLPVIPLGVHCDDFERAATDRQAARHALKVTDDDLVVLFVGRLSFHAKAHPDPVIAAVEHAAAQMGRPITLLHCGWYGSDFIREAFEERTALSAHKVRTIYLDGRSENSRRMAWSSADIFVSMSDNIQETFGLTPLEAMATGLPSIVTDWNGYRDTVRDGIDGFRVATTMPISGTGEQLAVLHEAGTITYDEYCGHSCQTVSFEILELAHKLVILARDRDLRKTMGQSARERVRSEFDWKVIDANHQELWAELKQRRDTAKRKGIPARLNAPRVSPARQDPTILFSSYATNKLGPRTTVASSQRPDQKGISDLLGLRMYNYAKDFLPNPEFAQRILDHCHANITVMDLAAILDESTAVMIEAVSALLKMGLLTKVYASRNASA